MKFASVSIFLGLCVLPVVHVWCMEGPGKEIDMREARTKIENRDTKIKAERQKIEEIEADRKLDKTERDTEVVKEGKKLKELLDAQVNDLRKFSVDFGKDFPRETETFNRKEGQTEAEVTALKEKIVKLERELSQSGTPIDVNPEGPTVKFDLSPDLKTQLDSDKTVSSRFSKKLEAFFNEFKAKINELPLFANPRKVIEARTRLNDIYDALGDIDKQINNLQNWGDYLIKSSMVQRDLYKVQQSVSELNNYITSLDQLNKKIASGDTAAKKEKTDLQKKALENILVKSAFDLEVLQEHLKGLSSTTPIINSEAAINKIVTLMNDTLLGFNVSPFVRSEAETKQVGLDETTYVKDFLTAKEFSKFGNVADSLMATLKTNFAGVLSNFPDYKQFNDYITKFDAFDPQELVNSKNLSDDEMFSFAQKVSNALYDIAESVGDRYEKLEKITPRTAKIAAELSFLNDFYKKVRDGLEKWEPIEGAYEFKIITNRELKEPRTIGEKIVNDNKNVATQKAKLDALSTKIQDVQATLFSDKRAGQILAPNEFISSYKNFQKQLSDFLAIINDPSTAPSRDAMKQMKRIMNMLDTIQASIESYGKTVHSFESAPTSEVKDGLAKILIDVTNKKALLENRIAVFKSALWVPDQDGVVHPLDQVSRDYAQTMQTRNDSRINGSHH